MAVESEFSQFERMISDTGKKLRFLESNNLMYKQQLVIIHLNKGKLRDMHYDDLRVYDWDNINVGIGFTGFSVTSRNGGQGEFSKVIEDWNELPLLKPTVAKQY